MGFFRGWFTVTVLALAACGSDHVAPDAAIDAAPDAKIWSDAPPPSYDVSCSGNAAPTTATAQITLSGVAVNAGLAGDVPVEGATVKACKRGAPDCAGSNQFGADATTAANGGWSIGPFNTSSMPADLFLAVTATGVRTTYGYPPSPLTADLGNVSMIALDAALLQFLSQACPQDDATKGIVIILVADCADVPIADVDNVTLSVKQGGTEVTGTSVVDFGKLKASLAGNFMICNVPANAATEVNATYKTTTFRGYTLGVVAGTTTNARVHPGY